MFTDNHHIYTQEVGIVQNQAPEYGPQLIGLVLRGINFSKLLCLDRGLQAGP